MVPLATVSQLGIMNCERKTGNERWDPGLKLRPCIDPSRVSREMAKVGFYFLQKAGVRITRTLKISRRPTSIMKVSNSFPTPGK